MNKLILSVGLALVFIILWSFQYYFSKKNGVLDRFKKHTATFYLDWIFLPFNILWPFVVITTFEEFLIILIPVFIIDILIHIYWLKHYISNGKEKNHLFNESKNNITGAGYSHFIFSTIQSSLVFSFFIFSINSFLTYVSYVLLLLFFLGGIVSSKKIHGKVQTSDLIFIILGIITLIVSFIL